jgi:hypothetical protein
MSDDTLDVEVITPSIDDLLHSIKSGEGHQTGQIFADLMAGRIDDALEQEKVRIAGQVYNGAEEVEDDSEAEEDFSDQFEQEFDNEIESEVDDEVEAETDFEAEEETDFELGEDEHEELEDDMGIYDEDEVESDIEDILSDEEDEE